MKLKDLENIKLIDLQNLGVYTDELKKYLEKQITESSNEIIIQEDSFLKFPTVGSEKTIYIDTTENQAYRWSDTDIKYYCVGSDYNDIETINGGSASS